jgi:uncharacterized protein
LRVTADSNIYVSAILFGGKPMVLLKLGLSRRIRLFISDDILDETLEVLREKFKRSPARLVVFEEFIRACTYHVTPTETLDVVPDDPDDNRVLECAVAGRCDYVVSGDGDLLRMGSFREIKIVTVSQFMTAVESN